MIRLMVGGKTGGRQKQKMVVLFDLAVADYFKELSHDGSDWRKLLLSHQLGRLDRELKVRQVVDTSPPKNL